MRVSMASSLMLASKTATGFWELSEGTGLSDEVASGLGALSVRPGGGGADGGFEAYDGREHPVGTNGFNASNYR